MISLKASFDPERFDQQDQEDVFTFSNFNIFACFNLPRKPTQKSMKFMLD